MTNERILYLDVIRILACIMVILMHSPISGMSTPGFLLTGISFLTAPCIGLFFMVSGALLLPVRMPMKDFYHKRLSKIIWPTLFWTICYVSISIIKGTITLKDLPQIILSIPFSAQGNGIMWFMYALIGLYLIAPIISPWLEKANRREIEFVLALWVVTLLYPVISSYINVNESHSGILYSFGGYSGYFLLGFYLRKFVNKTGLLIPLIMVTVPTVCCGIVYYYGFDGDFYQVFWYLSIFVAAMGTGWFLLIKNLFDGVYNCYWKIVPIISNLCFGVYLCHIIIMRELLWKIDLIRQMGSVTSILIITLLTLVLSILFSLCVAYLPYGRYIVGYQYNKRTDDS